MQVEITKKFQKQVDSCTDQSVRNKIANLIDKIYRTENIHDLSNLKKLKGSKNCFRIKFVQYRIGMIIENDLVILAAFDRRSDIYKYFP